MNTPDTIHRDFAAAVAGTMGHLEALGTTLSAERDALIGQQPETLQQIVRTKLELLAELERAVVARDRLQRIAGLPPGLEGGHRFVASHAPELAAAWDQLVQLCRQIDRSNTINGQLATQGARRARDALALLTGRDRVPQLYGRDRRQQQPVAIAGHSFGRV